MNKLLNSAEHAKEYLIHRNADQYSMIAAESEMRELNAENGEFSLFRTVFDQSFTANVIIGGRKGIVHNNDLSKKGIETVCNNALDAANSASADPANAFAPCQGQHCFESGCLQPDIPGFYARLNELKDNIRCHHPKVHLMSMNASHTYSKQLYMNSNGSEFRYSSGWYNVGLTFAGRSDDKVTGFFYTGIKTDRINQSLVTLGDIEYNLIAAESSLKTVETPGTFTGTVMLTPGCTAQFLYMLLFSYLDKNVILDGTSQWLNEIGNNVSSEKLTLSLEPCGEHTVAGKRFTAEGFISENVTLIENGILKNQLIDLYTSNKTGRRPVKCDDYAMYVKPGSTSQADMVRKIRKGLIVGGFSGGEPGTNGDFSGVAKNAFYVENGEIIGAVNEVMINGRLHDLFRNISDISTEICLDGSSAIPWITAEQIIISGK